jgi:predicted PurR-regulated permease PerM
MNEQKTKPVNTMFDNDWGSRNHVQTLVMMMATVLGIYLCYKMALPFLPVLVWALTLAVLFSPWQRWLESKLKSPSLAASIAVLLIGLIVVIPAVFVGQQLLLQAVKGTQLIEAKLASEEWQHTLEAQPQLAPILDNIEQKLDFTGAAKAFATWVHASAGDIVKASVVQVLGLCLIFYVLFFFLRDRRLILDSAMSLSPLSPSEMNNFYERIGDTIHATVYGTFAVASVQGFLGGFMFWWLDLPAPLLWGLIMGLLAVIPMLGAFIIWAPAALFLVLDGDWQGALILTLWGMLVVGTIDNLLRPILVGNRLRLHTVLTFLSVVGGLFIFGGAGLILGPVTLVATIALLEIWANRNSNEISS